MTASPTGYPDEEVFVVSLVRFEPTRKSSVLRILRDHGWSITDLRKKISDLPQILWEDYVLGENPRRDEAVEALKEFGQADLEFSRR